MGWTDWTPLPLATPFTQESLRKRLMAVKQASLAIPRNRNLLARNLGPICCRVSLDQDEGLLYRIPEELASQAGEALKNYFFLTLIGGRSRVAFPGEAILN